MGSLLCVRLSLIHIFKEILDGVHDSVPEQKFYMIGSIDDVKGK